MKQPEVASIFSSSTDTGVLLHAASTHEADTLAVIAYLCSRYAKAENVAVASRLARCLDSKGGEGRGQSHLSITAYDGSRFARGGNAQPFGWTDSKAARAACHELLWHCAWHCWGWLLASSTPLECLQGPQPFRANQAHCRAEACRTARALAVYGPVDTPSPSWGTADDWTCNAPAAST